MKVGSIGWLKDTFSNHHGLNSYALVSPKGKVKLEKNKACWAGLQHIIGVAKQRRLNQLHVVVGTDIRYPKECAELIADVFDKTRSPWRNCLQSYEWHDLERIATWHHGVNHIVKHDVYVLSLLNCHVSTQLFINMCCLLRIMLECAERLPIWKELKNGGMNTYEAMYLMSLFHLSQDSDHWIESRMGGHSPFDSYNMINLKTYTEGTPRYNTDHLMYRSGQFRPNTTIWGGGRDRTICLESLREIHKGDFKYTGIFPQLWNNHDRNKRDNHIYTAKSVANGWKELRKQYV